MGLLTARSIGALLENRWSGRLRSAFPQAVNILLSNGLIASLVKEERAMTAMSIMTPELFPAGSPTEGLQALDLQGLVGREVSRSGSQLALAGAARIDLERASTWKGKIATGGLQAITAETVPPLRDALLRHCRPGGLIGILKPEEENAFSRKAAGILSTATVRRGGPAHFMITGLSNLVGLGPGLTPSGDDFLTGALLGEQKLARWQRNNGQKPGTFVLHKPDISGALSTTTPEGKTLLWQAVRGHFPEYLLRLIRALSGTLDRQAMEQAVAEACSHGETSGTDALAGLVWMLERPS